MIRRSRELSIRALGWFKRPPIKSARYISVGACRKCGRKRTSGLYLYRYGHGVVLSKFDRGFVRESDVYSSRLSGGAVIDCLGCGQPQTAKRVAGRFNKSVPCNAKCTQAKGFSCECSCGGKNHGAGFGS